VLANEKLEFAVMVIFVIAWSILSYRYIEQPLIRAMRKWKMPKRLLSTSSE
jgi:peptidoglycan/LPS O-acetylase OafA/YrhL